MSKAIPEEIRWCVEAFPRDKKTGIYPQVAGAVDGSRTSQAAAAYMDTGRRLSVCQLAYGFLWNQPNREACRYQIDRFLERYHHDHGGIRRGRDLVLFCWAYETGEVRQNPASKKQQEVLRAIGPPVQPKWGNPNWWRSIAERFAQYNKEQKKAVIEIIALVDPHI
jgi:hypothetical protein